MKQSEKRELINKIETNSFKIVFKGCAASDPMISVSKVKKILDAIPTEQEEVTEVYVVKDCITGEVHWNAHGCPYKNIEDAEKKIQVLKKQKKPGESCVFTLLKFKLESKRGSGIWIS